uniref:Response regulator n=1 Tax=candidate division WOR-3 bacterium TaxID=2052148 RepID=A0A7V0Z6Y9_UNCW3
MMTIMGRLRLRVNLGREQRYRSCSLPGIKGVKMKKRIIICDDEEPIRLLLNEALKDDYEVVVCDNGRDVIKYITKENFDLLITDIKMPGTHGLEVIERIRERNKTIPIVVCSAYKLLEDDIVVKTSEIAAFITKPIEIKQLKAKIFELIGV